jgi:peptidoglycan/LPS O-acetylase OafA/YrhL
MHDTPPTSPGRLPPVDQTRPNLIMVGLAIHSLCALITCFVVPLAMNSNIWPIAGVFWSVFAVPAAMLTGAATGWLVKQLRQPVAISALIVTGVVLAIATGIIIANNR